MCIQFSAENNAEIQKSIFANLTPKTTFAWIS